MEGKTKKEKKLHEKKKRERVGKEDRVIVGYILVHVGSHCVSQELCKFKVTLVVVLRQTMGHTCHQSIMQTENKTFYFIFIL